MASLYLEIDVLISLHLRFFTGHFWRLYLVEYIRKVPICCNCKSVTEERFLNGGCEASTNYLLR